MPRRLVTTDRLNRQERDQKQSARLAERYCKGRSTRITVKEAAYQAIPEAYAKASGNGQYPANARQVMYAARPAIQDLTGRTLDDTYFDMLAMYCVAMRRDVLDAVGELDEAFGVGLFEDDDYSQRARVAGYEVVCTEESFVHHVGRASFAKLAESGAYQEIWDRNKAYYEAKWGPWKPHRDRRSGA